MAQRENSAVPASGLAVVVALLFGYLALHETTLERYRPPKTEKSSDQLIDLQDADARLWQDPFAAVQRHDEELQKVLTSTPRNEWAKRHVARHRFMALNKEISDALKESPVTILGVTVSSAPYPEDVERRQRYRYATLAGLNRASFTPENGDHLGYVTTRAVEGPAEARVHDLLQRLQRLAAVAHEQLGLVALEVQTRAVGRVLERHAGVKSERGDHLLEKLDDGLCGVGHRNQLWSFASAASVFPLPARFTRRSAAGRTWRTAAGPIM